MYNDIFKVKEHEVHNLLWNISEIKVAHSNMCSYKWYTDAERERLRDKKWWINEEKW